MKKKTLIPESAEPVGIVISRGDRTEAQPLFRAYIWAPAPEPVLEHTTKVA